MDILILLVLIYSFFVHPPGAFDKDTIGEVPAGWAAITGDQSNNNCKVEVSEGNEKTNILSIVNIGTESWCLDQAAPLKDGFFGINLKIEGQSPDKSASVVWRWVDIHNYYGVELKPGQSMAAVYSIVNGEKKVLETIELESKREREHSVLVGFKGDEIDVLIDRTEHVMLKNNDLAKQGFIGVTTSAGSGLKVLNFWYGRR